MPDWEKYKIEDILSIVKESVNPCNIDECNYIGLEHIAGKSFLLNDIGSSQDVESNKYFFQPNDILYGKLRPYFQKVYKPNFEGICSTDIFVIRTKDERVVSQDFLYQIVREKKFTEWAMEGHTGTRMPRADWQALRKKMVLLPNDLNEQHRIASILGTLDDKIELNLEMNKTLEEMAMAIYKEWFVDFGPFRDGEFVDSELGPIPKEWEVMKIDEAIDTFGGGTPKTSVKEYWENGEIIWYSPTDLTNTNSLFSLGSEKKITNLGLQKSSAKLFPPYSLLMSSRATIGAITINRYEACTNQGFITLVPNKQFTVYQLFGWLHQNMDTIKNLANGSTFREISKGVFREFRILKAGDIDNYFKISKPIFDQIENNLIENNILTETRDYLLPKLISGEIRVKAAEEKLKEVL